MKMENQEAGVNRFSCTNDIVDELEVSLSKERLATCLHAAQGDRERAIRLHVRNTDVCAAFCGPLQGLEVALRNAMHRRLANRYGDIWYDNGRAGLDQCALNRIAGARTELTRERRRNDPQRTVAALSLGIWVSLLGPGGRCVDGRKANYEMSLQRRLHIARAVERSAVVAQQNRTS